MRVALVALPFVPFALSQDAEGRLDPDAALFAANAGVPDREDPLPKVSDLRNLHRGGMPLSMQALLEGGQLLFVQSDYSETPTAASASSRPLKYCSLMILPARKL